MFRKNGIGSTHKLSKKQNSFVERGKHTCFYTSGYKCIKTKRAQKIVERVSEKRVYFNTSQTSKHLIKDKPNRRI